MKKTFVYQQAVLGTVLLVLAGSSCSALHDMEDMKNTTQTMSGTTQDMDGKISSTNDKIAHTNDTMGSMNSTMNSMNSTTETMSSTTQDMDSTMTGMASTTTQLLGATNSLLNLTGVLVPDTNNLYFDLKEGNTVELRADMLRKMNQATTFEGKLSMATIYFEAFEFELWTGTQYDTPAQLDEDYLEALQQFDRDVTQYMPTDYNANLDSQSNQSLNLFALAVAMHMTNKLEINEPILPEDTAAHTSPYKVSMIDLIQSSLVAAYQVHEGNLDSSSETDWQHEGSTNQQLFQSLMRTRENFLAEMVLAKVSKLHNPCFVVSEGSKILDSLFDWGSSIPELNEDQLLEYATWMNESVRVRDFLKGIDADASIDGAILNILSKMKQPASTIVPDHASSGELTDAKKRNQDELKLWSDLQTLIKG